MLLGPSLLGKLAPDVSAALFPPSSLSHIAVLSQLRGQPSRSGLPVPGFHRCNWFTAPECGPSQSSSWQLLLLVGSTLAGR